VRTRQRTHADAGCGWRGSKWRIGTEEAVNLPPSASACSTKAWRSISPCTFGTLASVAGLAGLVETVEQDNGIFMERDCASVSFNLTDFGAGCAPVSVDLAELGSQNAHLSGAVVAPLQSGAVKRLAAKQTNRGPHRLKGPCRWGLCTYPYAGGRATNPCG
jgi:hypothetical protein